MSAFTTEINVCCSNTTYQRAALPVDICLASAGDICLVTLVQQETFVLPQQQRSILSRQLTSSRDLKETNYWACRNSLMEFLAPPRPPAILGVCPQTPVKCERGYGQGLTAVRLRSDRGYGRGLTAVRPRPDRGPTAVRPLPGGCDSSRLGSRGPIWLAEAATAADFKWGSGGRSSPR